MKEINVSPNSAINEILRQLVFLKYESDIHNDMIRALMNKATPGSYEHLLPQLTTLREQRLTQIAQTLFDALSIESLEADKFVQSLL